MIATLRSRLICRVFAGCVASAGLLAGAEDSPAIRAERVGAVAPRQLEFDTSGYVQMELLGGETAEHGGIMGPDDIDVAGFAVGVLEDGTQLGAHRVRSAPTGPRSARDR